jgi:hypothetical protein
MRRSCLAIQFWEGDRDVAMRNARRIADNEPAFRPDVDFVFAARFDCPQDKDTIAYVSRKFKVIPYTSTRREVGWPVGSNALWSDLMVNFVLGKHLRGEWPDTRWVLTFEADGIPVHPDWINKLDAEWDRAAALGKCIVGCWMPFGTGMTGHINGNLMISPDAGAKFNIIGTPIGHAWDVYFAPQFEPHWFKTGLIANFYRDTKVSDEHFKKCWQGAKEPAVFVHGVKDESTERYADRVLRKLP